MLVAYLFVRRLRAEDTRALLMVGLLSLVLTVACEFAFGHFAGTVVGGLPSDYNLAHCVLMRVGLGC